MRWIGRSIFLCSFTIIGVYAFENWDIGIGADLYMPKPSGSIENVASGKTNFSELGYTKSTPTSILHLNIRNRFDYIPDLKVSYFHLKDTHGSDLNKTVQIAGEDYNASVQSDIDYSMLSAVFYKSFVLKGEYFSFFSNSIYSGDLEFQLGIDTRVLQWQYTIQDKTDLKRSPSWIQAQTVVPLVYFGANYYFYNLVLEAQTSTLAISESKIIEYNIGLKYRFGDSLYLQAGYLYSNIQFVHNEDEIDYTAKGARGGFEYFF